MIIDHKHRWVYLGVPRTGSRMLHSFFKSVDNGDGQYSFLDQHTMAVPAECENYFIFGTVRHPYSRVISMWRLLVWDWNTQARWLMEPVPRIFGDEAISFSKYLELIVFPNEESFPPIYRNTCSDYLNSAHRVDAVLKQERLCRDLLEIFRMLEVNVREWSLPRPDPASVTKQSGQQFYTPELFESVIDWGLEDLRRFDYSKTQRVGKSRSLAANHPIQAKDGQPHPP